MTVRNALAFRLVALLVCGLALVSGVDAGEVLVKSGDTIAFFGDSITQRGANGSAGFINMVISGLKAAGVDAKPLPAGINGQKTDQLLSRLERDVIARKPVWMVLNCGVSDVWLGDRGTPLEQFKENVEAIVLKARQAGIQVVITTATMISEDANADNNRKLAAYNEFLRSLARRNNLPLADVNIDMTAEVDTYLAEGKASVGNFLTTDGVHLNVRGNMMMARGILRAFGLEAQKVSAAQKGWLEDKTEFNVAIDAKLTVAQYLKLQDIALEKDVSFDRFLENLLRERITELVGGGGGEQTAKPGAGGEKPGGAGGKPAGGGGGRTGGKPQGNRK